MQFPVPQFIDVEDKIIGPFTLKQFGFVFGAGLIILGFFKLFGYGIVFFVLSLPVAIGALIVAFATFNGRKLYNFLPVMLKFYTADKVMVFQRNRGENVNVEPLSSERISALTAAQAEANPAPEEPIQSRLKKIALQLDRKNNEEVEAIRSINKNNP